MSENTDQINCTKIVIKITFRFNRVRLKWSVFLETFSRFSLRLSRAFSQLSIKVVRVFCTLCRGSTVVILV